jgi:hypothetical protein
MMRAHVLVALACVALGGACRFDSWRFYDVTRIATDQCDILPEGEFCDPDVLPPPENEGWSIERTENIVRIYVDDEVWLATADEENPDKLTAKKLEVRTADPGPCTNTRTRTLTTTDDAQVITGKLVDEAVLTGDSDCGEVPRGDRLSFTIDGVFTGSP